MPTDPAPGDAYRSAVRRLRGDFWWLRLLAHRRSRLFASLVPWPLPYIVWPLARASFARRASWTRSHVYSTVALGGMVVAIYAPGVTDPAEVHLFLAGIEAAGVMVVATLAGVAVALPGSGLVQRVVSGRPDVALDYLLPYIWAIFWGVLGVGSLVVLAALGRPELGSVGFAALVWMAWYGGGALVNAFFFVLQVFGGGLLDLSKASAPKQ